MANDAIRILGFMTVPPGTEQRLLAAVDELVAKTRAEIGCLNYDLHQHLSDSTRFVFYENFTDMAAFESHFAQAHTRAWLELAGSYGAVFDVQFWRMLTVPQGEVLALHPSPDRSPPDSTEVG
jgi:quinol monooxygenase YgiN